jgi:hypothetical protein
MRILLIANVAALLIAVWAVWECRHSFRSRWDSPRTMALMFFGIGVALDSPWRAFSEVQSPLAGRYYFLTLIGHICYLVAGALGDKFIYLRLLPDSAIGPFMRTRILPLILLAATVMVVSFAASPVTAALTADQLYLLRPDGWLTVYWLTYYATMTAVLVIAMYGVNKLRTDPRSVMLNLLLAALVLAALSCVASAWGVLGGRSESIRLLAWPIAYVAISAGAVAVVVAWRHRADSMLRP